MRKNTMPPLNRGHMTPRPWNNFWDIKLDTPETYSVGNFRRQILLLTSIVFAMIASSLIAPQIKEANSALYYVQLGLFFVLFMWISLGFVTAFMGAWVLYFGDKYSLSSKGLANKAITSKTAVIMTICNEEIETVFAGLKATIDSANKINPDIFDFFILSDTPSGETAQKELEKFKSLNIKNLYYRRRIIRTKKKAGNVEDFCRRWGNNYNYMVVLDADSIMTGECLEKLTRLMDENPTAGIIQTVPKTCGHNTVHARVEQFSSRMIGKIFTLGMQFWQLGESHYWGHNAIIRIKPFMEHCSLAKIKGSHNLSGSVLSHDFLEAALMRRAGYKVWLCADLEGSYEQQPPNMLAELQRDRRWCQGNLQNIQLVTQPGLHMAHRGMLITGVMSYLSAPLWLAFFLLGTFSWLVNEQSVLNIKANENMYMLWLLTAFMLIAPRFMGVMVAILTKETKEYGGTFNLFKSTGLEFTLSLFKAPIKMVAHSIFVFGAITGFKLEWKSPPREANNISWTEVASFCWSFSLASSLILVTQIMLSPQSIYWLLPVCIPLLLSIPVIFATGNIDYGNKIKNAGWLLTPEETKIPQVVIEAEKNLYRVQKSFSYEPKEIYPVEQNMYLK